MSMVDLYAKALPAEAKKKRIPVKCSTCADRTCRERGKVCDWMHCWKWKGGDQAGGK